MEWERKPETGGKEEAKAGIVSHESLKHERWELLCLKAEWCLFPRTKFTSHTMCPVICVHKAWKGYTRRVEETSALDGPGEFFPFITYFNQY